MTRFLAAIAVLVACAAVPAVAGAQPPPNPPDLRITTTPNPVKFGEDVRIFGELTRRPGSGITIELSEDPFPFDAFATVATALTDIGSGYSFTRTPTVNTRYQTRQGATTSRIATALVRPSISLRVSSRRLATGRSVRFSGRVCPEHVGASLAIQRRTAPKRWRTVRRTTLADLRGSSCSSYARRLRVRRSGIYRTFLAAHADHADSSSGKHRIDAP